ncbi:MAG: FAD-dependent oxidoreductase [Desulfuromonadales bacterium]|nr:FAD-dependent oxidoreductase [Desulfuromonadales bacterium]
MNCETDVLVIGGGPAGITFSLMVKKLDPSIQVTMFRPESHSVVYCAIPYAIEGLFEPEKVLKDDAMVTGSGVELVYKKIISIDLLSRKVVTEDGDSCHFRRLFIATGATPARPPVPGIEAENVFTVKTKKDMDCLIDKLNSGVKRAVVVGAGAIGIEQAQAYRARGVEVDLIEMANHILPNLIDTDMSVQAQQALVDQGIRLRLGTRLDRLETAGALVTRVVLDNGENIELDPAYDFVTVCTGMLPDIQLFHDQGLAVSRDGILVDACMRTNLPEVYAAGDCCAFFSGIDGKPVAGKLATNAVPMGKIAARCMLGQPVEHEGFINGAATCAGPYRVGGTGFTEAEARRRGFAIYTGYGNTTSFFPMMPGTTEVLVKIVADLATDRILGGQVVARTPTTDKVDVITLAIQQKLTVQQLARLSYSAQPWQSFLPARNPIVEACETALSGKNKQAAA